VAQVVEHEALSLTPSAGREKSEKINFCCLAHIVYDILLQQSKQTNNIYCARHNTKNES
jgi:hypothetical protein